MTPQQKLDFRDLLLNYTKAIPEQDAQELMNAVYQLEAFVDRCIDNAILKAVAPYVKINVKNS